ncbi:hypothetical protein Tco_0552058 [Tanacetum coccineum]
MGPGAARGCGKTKERRKKHECLSREDREVRREDMERRWERGRGLSVVLSVMRSLSLLCAADSVESSLVQFA